jgi:hypothetical protein
MPDDLGDEKIPCIVIPPIYHPQSNYAPHINDPLLALIAALREPAHSPTIVDLIGSLVQEGKFFAKSSSGLNWAAILSILICRSIRFTKQIKGYLRSFFKAF